MSHRLHRFRVPFDQLDPGGILFYGHLFTHAHHAFETLLREIGWGLVELLAEERYRLPVVHAEADYHAPLQLDAQIDVVVAVRHIGERSFTLGYRFLHEEVLCATVGTAHVLVDAGNSRPAPLPEALRQALSRYCESN